MEKRNIFKRFKCCWEFEMVTETTKFAQFSLVLLRGRRSELSGDVRKL